VPAARHCPEVTIDEALELSRSGCRFLQDRAIEWAASATCRISIRAIGDPRATEIVGRRSGPPRVVAITHAASGTRGLVSLVGDSVAIDDPATAAQAGDALSSSGIPWSASQRTAHRLTIEVPRDRLADSHVLVHDRIFASSRVSGPVA
jgi:aspartokinase